MRRSTRLLIDEQPLQVIPTLAAKLGINAAILLQQIHYWIKSAEESGDARKFKRGRWWTYNTYSDWQKQMPWLSESGIRKLVQKLKDKELVAVIKHGSDARDHTLWYTINYDKLDTLGQIDVPESDTSKRPGGADLDVTESDTSNKTENPENRSESVESNDSRAKPNSQDTVVSMNKYVVDAIYAAMREAGYRMPNEDFKFHLGRAQDMLEKDGPTDEEIEALPAAFVGLYEIRGRADAPSSLVELRRQAARARRIASSGHAPGHSRGPKPGRAPGGNGTEPQGTPQVGIEALRNYVHPKGGFNDLRQYAGIAERFDFSGDADPDWRIMRELDDDPLILRRIRSVVRRSLREETPLETPLVQEEQAG